MKTLKLVALCALSLAFVGCANKVATKEDAAKAMNRLTAASNNAGSSAKPGGGLGSDVTVSVNGKSGTATVTLHIDISDPANSQSLNLKTTEDIKYDNFSVDGENTFDGTCKFEFSTKLDSKNPTSVALDMHLVGKVTMSGEYDTDLDFDVTVSMNASDLQNQSGGKVTMLMNGHIKADGQDFTYTNESITVDAVKS